MNSELINNTPVDFKDFSLKERKKFLTRTDVKQMLTSLPKNIKETLVYSFLNNIGRSEAPYVTPGWKEVMEYFHLNSKVVPELSVNPGTFTMLDRMYWKRGIGGPIDEFFYDCKACDALRNRLKVISDRTAKEIMALGNQPVTIVDLGSGPGDYPIQAIKKLPIARRNQVTVDCFEIDAEAIKEGKKLAYEEKLNNFNFYFENIITYRHYNEKADIGLLIGILCPLKKEDGVKFLKSIKRYLKPGGKLIAATLLDSQLKEDLFPSYLVRELSGWNLDYKLPGELREMFLEAGYTCEDTFADEPTRFYDICVGS